LPARSTSPCTESSPDPGRRRYLSHPLSSAYSLDHGWSAGSVLSSCSLSIVHSRDLWGVCLALFAPFVVSLHSAPSWDTGIVNPRVTGEGAFCPPRSSVRGEPERTSWRVGFLSRIRPSSGIATTSPAPRPGGVGDASTLKEGGGLAKPGYYRHCA
jgi:hypothetical protein